MPTLQEILSDIDTRLPNAFTNDQKIYWINEAQRQLFKYMNDNEIYEFTTIENQPIYSLPSDCIIDQILSVRLTKDTVVTPSSAYSDYMYTALNDKFTGNNYYDAYNRKIGLYPVPDATGCNVKIFYRKRPFLLSPSNLTVTPEINEDYQPALSFYTLSVIAGAGNNPDVQLVNNYRSDFNDVVSLLFKDLMEKKAKNPANPRANPWW